MAFAGKILNGGAFGALSLLAACSASEPGGRNVKQPVAAIPQPASAPGAQAVAAPVANPAPAANGAQGGSTLQAVNAAQFSPPVAGASRDASDRSTPDPALIRAEVLLDRARFSPGVIDGRMGENVSNALVAFEKAHGLPTERDLNPKAWQALTDADKAPALESYTLTAQDVAGPWSPDVGEDLVKLSKLDRSGFTNPVEMLGERFHMDEDLLKRLNPGADFTKAGTAIVVAETGGGALAAVSDIEVDKRTKSVTAYDGLHKLLAVFPATVGSTERPSPKGVWKVKGVAQNPDYTYDPSKLTWGPRKAGKLHVPPGPNGPVGVVWIALSAPDYGIHGTPDPRVIGKTASHGCVRLTNWDAETLSRAVKPGVKVSFAS